MISRDNFANHSADGINWELLYVYCHDEEPTKFVDLKERMKKGSSRHRPRADPDVIKATQIRGEHALFKASN